MRVIHALPGATVGGAEVQVLRLSNALQRLGTEVCIYFGQPGGQLDTSGLSDQVDVVVAKAGSFPARVARLHRFIDAWGADIVHVHMSPAAYVASRLSSRARTVSHLHTAFNPRRHSGIRDHLSRLICQGDITIACSEAAKRDYLHTTSTTLDQVRVIYNGLDFAAFDEQAAVDPEDAALVPDGVFSIAATKLGWSKGTDILLQALGRVGAKEDWRLVVIGEGGQHHEYVQMSRDLGISERIVFLGLRPLHEIPAILSQCDCFAQISRLEGLGIAIIEASAARLPVAATRVGGIPEVVRDRDTGVLVPTEDVAALADAFLFMLRNPDEARAMGVRGRQYVEEVFNIHDIAVATLDVYRSILA